MTNSNKPHAQSLANIIYEITMSLVPDGVRSIDFFGGSTERLESTTKVIGSNRLSVWLDVFGENLTFVPTYGNAVNQPAIDAANAALNEIRAVSDLSDWFMDFTQGSVRTLKVENFTVTVKPVSIESYETERHEIEPRTLKFTHENHPHKPIFFQANSLAALWHKVRDAFGDELAGVAVQWYMNSDAIIGAEIRCGQWSIQNYEPITYEFADSLEFYNPHLVAVHVEKRWGPSPLRMQSVSKYVCSEFDVDAVAHSTMPTEFDRQAAVFVANVLNHHHPFVEDPVIYQVAADSDFRATFIVANKHEIKRN